NTPLGPFLHPSTGNCWVADRGNNQVVKISPNGTELLRVNGFTAPVWTALDAGEAAGFQPPVVDASASILSGATPLAVNFDAQVSDPDGTVLRYQWDFEGDGVFDQSSEISADISHTYTEMGIYNPIFRAVDDQGLTGIDSSLIVRAGSLTATASADVLSGPTPLTVRFTGSFFDPVDGRVESFQWDFDGDGQFDFFSETSAAATHTYDQEGQYVVVFKVTDTGGLTAQDTLTLQSTRSEPSVSAYASPTQGSTPLEVNFSGNGNDQDGYIVLYQWDFDGDGQFDYSSTSGGNASHVYQTRGVFRPFFMVTDNDGLFSSSTLTVEVGNSQPTAWAVASPMTGNAALQVSLQGNGIDPDGSIVQYEWTKDGSGGFADNMESGPGRWQAGYPWGLTTEHAHSGDTCWTDSPGRDYVNNAIASLITPSIDLSQVSVKRFSFWHRRDLDSGDRGNLSVSTDGGATWTHLANYTGADVWQISEISLSSYGAETDVQFRFSFSSDSSVVGDGWYIDDVRIGSADDSIFDITATAPTVTYDVPGVYHPTLKVTDNDGGVGYDWVEVAVSQAGTPTVQAQATPDSGAAPLAVNFAATASDPGGSISSYEWLLEGAFESFMPVFVRPVSAYGSDRAERLAWNPVTGHLLVSSFGGALIPAGIHVIDPDTGATLSGLQQTGVTFGGSKAYHALAVASDGKIFHQDSNGDIVYWASESSLPVKAYDDAEDDQNAQGLDVVQTGGQTYLFSVGNLDETVRIFRLAGSALTLVNQFDASTAGVGATASDGVAASGDGRTVYVSAAGGTVTRWTNSTGPTGTYVYDSGFSAYAPAVSLAISAGGSGSPALVGVRRAAQYEVLFYASDGSAFRSPQPVLTSYYYDGCDVDLDLTGNRLFVTLRSAGLRACDYLSADVTATGSNASHTFSLPGQYRATVRVTDNSGLIAEDSVLVRVGAAPVATILRPMNGGEYSRNTVPFIGTGRDIDGAIVSYEWDFEGDGIWDFQSEVSGVASHFYSSAGSYTARFRVTDDTGLTDVATVDIQALAQAPLVDAEAAPSKGHAPLTVVFAGSVEDPDGEIALCEWDFDSDGAYDWSNVGPVGSVVSYSSQENWLHSAQKLIDQKFGNDDIWRSVSSTFYPQEIVFELQNGAVHSISRVNLTLNATSSWRSQNVKDFEVLVSTAGPTGGFTTVLTTQTINSGRPEQVYDFPATDARYVMLRVLSNWGSSYVTATEFEVFTPGNENVLSPPSIHAFQVYEIPGDYTATVRVTDDDGQSVTQTVDVRVLAPGFPVARIESVVPSPGYSGQIVSFTATGVDDGSISLYEWDFDGNGTYDISSPSEPNVTHAYPAPTPLLYHPVFRVTDNEANTDTDTTQVRILPDGLTSGTIWVANGGSDQMVRLDNVGQEEMRIGGYDSAYAVDIDPSSRAVWFTAINADRVVKFSPDGTELANVAGFDHPNGIAIDTRDGSVWVSDTYHDQVVKLDSSGSELVRVSGFNDPEDLAVNPTDGSVWVADRLGQQLVKMAANVPDGYDLAAQSTHHTAYTDVGQVSELVLDPADGSCVGVDATNDDVIKVAADGVTRQWLVSGFQDVTDVALNPADSTIWVLDRGAGMVARLDPDGSEILRAYGLPYLVRGAVNPLDGTLWVTRSSPHGVLQLSPTGRIVRSISGYYYPVGLAIDTEEDGLSNPPAVTASAAYSGADTPLTVALTGNATDDGTIMYYEWDFEGDGVFDFASTTTGNTSHVYEEPGIYNPVLRAFDNDRQVGYDYHLLVRAGVLTARASASVTRGYAALSVIFTSGGVDPFGQIVQYEWDWTGDGVFDQTDTRPLDRTYNYNRPGLYTAVLRVTNSQGDQAYDTLTIDVQASPPVAQGSVASATGGGSHTFMFDGQSSYDSDGSIILYQWDYDGDGVYDWGSSESGVAYYYYPTPGVFYPVLRVTDNDGRTGQRRFQVTVSNLAPISRPVASPESGNAPLNVAFSSDSTDPDGEIVLYEWDFENDGVYDASNPSTGDANHTYGAAGAYPAKLQVTDGHGTTHTATVEILVRPAGSPSVTLSVTPDGAKPPFEARFSASASDLDGTIVSYLWDFGDTYETNPSGYPTQQLFMGTWAATGADDVSSSRTAILAENPSPGDAFEGRLWAEKSDAGGVFNWRTVFGVYQNVYGYSLVYFYLPTAQTVRVHYGTSQAARFWVDENLVEAQPHTGGYLADQFNFDVALSAGWHKLLASVSSNTYYWTLGYRFTDTSDSPLLLRYTLNEPFTDPPIVRTTSSGDREYVYRKTGVFTPSLTVTDNDGKTAMASVMVNAYSTYPPVALPRAYPQSGFAPLTVDFYSDGTDPDGTIAYYLWDFDGDGVYESNPGDWDSQRPSRVSHTYYVPGVYQATLKVIDDGIDPAIGESQDPGAYDEKALTIYVDAPPPPQARGMATPDDGTAPLNVEFTGYGSDLNGTIELFEWDFDGNGTWDSSSPVSAKAVHTYASPGFYEAVLRVTDSDNETGTDSVYVDVKETNSPTAILTANPQTGGASLDVVFTASATDPDGWAATIEWDFEGDGVWDRTSAPVDPAGETIHYIYGESGTFLATIRVTDNDGKTDLARVPIEVAYGIEAWRTKEAFDPTQGETIGISTAVTADSEVTVRVVDRMGETVRELITDAMWNLGIHSVEWDGRNGVGDLVSGGAYYFVIDYSVDGQTWHYDLTPTATPNALTPSVQYPSTFNPIEDRPFYAQYTLAKPAEITVYTLWAPNSSPQYAVKTLLLREPRKSGTYVDIWDGTDDEGNLVGPGTYSLAVWSYELPDNALIVASRPIISDVSKDPDYFSPGHNPYLVQPEMEIRYHLSKPASVTIRIENEVGAVLKTFRQDQGASGNKTATWNGLTKDGYLPEPGNYKISLKAVDAFGNESITVYSLFRIFY
ncbi:PKD domain-containing protein, partial [bacterium]|nr:PKD domain-containing protein [bacterium]